MYSSAFDKPRDEVVDLKHIPTHLQLMLNERTDGKTAITQGDIIDNFAPTFEEARRLGALRARTFSHALDLFDEKRTVISKHAIPPEVIDFMFDKLPGGQPYGYYEIWDVIEALRPTPEEAQQIERRPSELKNDWQALLQSFEPPASDDGTTWCDEDLDF